MTTDKDFYDLCLSKVSYEPDSGKFFWKGSGFECTSTDVGGYKRIKVNGRTMKLHRLAWYAVTGEIPSMLDHSDRDKSNNKVSNLRVCSQSENARNRKSVGASPFKGVCYRKTDNKWVSRILVDGKREFLGAFKREIDAALAYDKRAATAYRQYAVLNFDN